MAVTSGEYIDITEFLKDAGFVAKTIGSFGATDEEAAKVCRVMEKKSFIFKILAFLGLNKK